MAHELPGPGKDVPGFGGRRVGVGVVAGGQGLAGVVLVRAVRVRCGAVVACPAGVGLAGLALRRCCGSCWGFGFGLHRLTPQCRTGGDRC